MGKTKSIFTVSLQVRTPPALRAAIELGAEKQFMMPSEYVRRAIIDKLKFDGIDLSQPETKRQLKVV